MLASSDAFTGQVRDTSKADRVTLLDVYRDGYALRLIEVLTIDYPRRAGDGRARRLRRTWRAPISPTIPRAIHRCAGSAGSWPTSWPTRAPYNSSPALAEMARFEWALGEAFDSVDADAGHGRGRDGGAARGVGDDLPSRRSRRCSAWPSPTTCRRRGSAARRSSRARSRSRALDAPVPWVIWRPERVSNFRSLEPDEAAMLGAMVERPPFPALCEALLPYVEEDQAAARAAGLLRAWVEEGMIGSFSH